MTLSPLDLAYQAESGRARVVSQGMGELARAHTKAYDAALPADGGTPAIMVQPRDVERFGGAVIGFTGGSSYTDLPEVRVERLVDGAWVPYEDQTGAVQTEVRFPTPKELPAFAAGEFVWQWTASFEAFVSEVELPDLTGERRRATPAGTYRFAVEGKHGTAPGHVVEPVGPFTTQLFDGRTHEYGPIDYPDGWAWEEAMRSVADQRLKTGRPGVLHFLPLPPVAGERGAGERHGHRAAPQREHRPAAGDGAGRRARHRTDPRRGAPRRRPRGRRAWRRARRVGQHQRRVCCRGSRSSTGERAGAGRVCCHARTGCPGRSASRWVRRASRYGSRAGWRTCRRWRGRTGRVAFRTRKVRAITRVAEPEDGIDWVDGGGTDLDNLVKCEYVPRVPLPASLTTEQSLASVARYLHSRSSCRPMIGCGARPAWLSVLISTADHVVRGPRSAVELCRRG